MTRSRCILITSTFPVRGETFLRYEIGHLSQAFDTVEILSIANGKHAPTDSADHQFLRQFPNVHYKGDIACFTPCILIPSLALLVEALLELPAAMSSARSLMKQLYRLFLATRVMRYLVREYPDDGSCVFYAYWLNAGAIALAALDHRKNLRVGRAHGSDIYDENIKSGFNSFHHFCARHLDRVFCISDHGRAYLSAKTRNPVPFEVARLGVSLPEITQDFREVDEEEPIEIVSCSVIDANKRLDLIIDALRALAGQRINWTHIGGGPEFGQIRDACETLPPGITTTFTGSVDNAEIHRLYSTRYFDLFVNTSRSEGIPVAAMEAMSYAIPCLATDVGGTKELIVQGAGRIVPVDISGRKLGAELLLLANERRQSDRAVSEACRRKIEKDFCEQTNFHAFAQRLKTIVPSERPSQ